MELSQIGIKANKIKQFNSKGIYSIEDLLYFTPVGHYDFSTPKNIQNVQYGETVSIIGTLIDVYINKNIIKATLMQNNRWLITITWFNQTYMANFLTIGKTYIACGKIVKDKMFNNKSMINPIFFSQDIDKYKKIIPIYSKIKGMSDEFLLNSIESALKKNAIKEYLEPYIIDKYQLYDLPYAINSIHNPQTLNDVKMGKRRLLFDDLFAFAYALRSQYVEDILSEEIKINKRTETDKFIKTLPFQLTQDQLDTTNQIYSHMNKNIKVNALIQGDVGCGKTIIAFILMLIAAENGFQSLLMCPTNVLATQHFNELSNIAGNMGLEVAFLYGGMPKKKRETTLKRIKDGEIKLVIGTHAVISEDVEFKNLALGIVDEEHRFGVEQRNAIIKKSQNIHFITMSATPIPRSLALTLYGDNIQIYNILQMPNGRKPVITSIIDDRFKAYQFIKNEVQNNRQAYVVCPLIETSESVSMAKVLSAEDVFDEISDFFKNTGVTVGLINGNMKKKDIEAKINEYKENKIHVLVSTTIIEVGVNIPNATIISILNAERFGMSQLHQLRGRVGRSDLQSYCLLVSEDKFKNEKLKVMAQTTNGFEVAEADLRLRGSGNLFGVKQSGINKYVDLMLSNIDLFEKIKKDINEIFLDKKRLAFYEKTMKEKIDLLLSEEEKDRK